jgi:hypothetical protein
MGTLAALATLIPVADESLIMVPRYPARLEVRLDLHESSSFWSACYADTVVTVSPVVLLSAIAELMDVTLQCAREESLRMF